MSRSIGTWAFNKNDRIRAVIAWNNCATNGVDSPPLPVVPDFDLFIWSPTQGYVYSSQSVWDNTEGFDIDIAVADTYNLLVAWPAGATGCSGGTTEPLAWAIQWWH
jgi:hypothetical protein